MIGYDANRKQYLAVATMLLMGAWGARALAQDHDHGGVQNGELVKVVREATERFRDVRVAEAEGYALQFGCLTGPDW